MRVVSDEVKVRGMVRGIPAGLLRAAKTVKICVDFHRLHAIGLRRLKKFADLCECLAFSGGYTTTFNQTDPEKVDDHPSS